MGSAPVAAGKNGTTPARDCVACADKFNKHSGGKQLRSITTFGRFGVFLVHLWPPFVALVSLVCLKMFKDVQSCHSVAEVFSRGVSAVFCSFEARK